MTQTERTKMNVLSLFDGMSCGQIALDNLGIKVDNYFSSEIDKFAMKVAKKNYPGTKHIGSVIDLTREQLLELGDIDLLIGGSPCQGFSFAGKQKGSATKCGVDITSLSQYLEFKELGFGFEGQSYLFWEYVRVWKIVKPKNFLLENVRITKKWQTMFDNAMGVEPIVINSALVSAQNRVRYYWSNIDGVKQPKDRGVILRDILEDGEKVGLTTQRLEVRKDEKSNCLTTVGKDNVVVRPIRVGTINKGSQGDRIYSAEGKSITLSAQSGGTAGAGNMLLAKLYNVNPSGNGMNGNVYGVDAKLPTITTNKGEGTKVSPDRGLCYRKLTPVECERLQTVPDNYTDCVSNSQRYKMLGNGWTVVVIAHILSNLK